MEPRDRTTTVRAAYGALGLRLAYAITGNRKTAERAVEAAAERCTDDDWLVFLALVREACGPHPRADGAPERARVELRTGQRDRLPAGAGALPVDLFVLEESVGRLSPEDRTTLVNALIGRHGGPDADERLAAAICALRDRIRHDAFPSAEDIP